jgi:hypothetical protein
MQGYPPPRFYSTRNLLVDAQFDPSATELLTLLHLGTEKLADGTVSPPITLECHGNPLALQVEHLKAKDEISFEYSTHWPHKMYDRDREIGVYIEKWVCRTVISTSRERVGPARTIPHRQGYFGPYELAQYSALLASVKGHF